MSTASSCTAKTKCAFAIARFAIAISALTSQPARVLLAAESKKEHASDLPPDLPLRASPPSKEQWLREANVLQPYGHSAYVAVTDIRDRPARLKKEFGFNAIIVQPPDSHNTIAAAADKLTEEQFTAGLAAYRAAGYRIMLYTSVMALGLSPEFQSGKIAKEHPDWLQRDPKNNPVLAWSVPWLCPSTGARAAALDRCLRIVREYKADGVMLDNNEFFFADADWTCHCESCTKAFRDYVQKRFGDDDSKKLFGVSPKEIKIPTVEGPLYFEWLHWRNRVWADVNESFRGRLREQDPKIMFFANTQYAYENGMLGTDDQYAREDVVLSESCELDSRQMSAKMVLGNAVAQERPLWNYVGTFAKGDDYTGLRSPEVVGPAIAATLAHNARPWIVDGFDEGPTNPQSRELMSKLLGWQARHPRLFGGMPIGSVATIISPESRNVRHTPLIPPHLPVLQAAGVPVVALRDDALTAEQLQPFKIVTIESDACLPAKAATVLAGWVRGGGTLVATSTAGTYDEIGRKHSESLLLEALELSGVPQESTALGAGQILFAEPPRFANTAIRITHHYSFLKKGDSGLEVVPYRSGSSILLHVVRHDRNPGPVEMRLPKTLTATGPAKLFTPDSDEVRSLPVTVSPDGATLKLPSVSLYAVLEIPVQ